LAYLKSKDYKQVYELFRNQLNSNLHILWNDAYEAKDSESCKWLEEKFIQYSSSQTHFKLALRYNVKSLFKPIVQKLRNARAKWNIKRTTASRRRKLCNTDFTIISNNCWGGLVYQYFGLPYNSPTVGLFIMDDDYIKFLERFDYYIDQPLRFITFESSRYYDYLSRESTAKMSYPIAMLDDIEIHFLHFHSQVEADEKWKRRCKRINRKRLLIKMSQRFIRDIEILNRFDNLPFRNKICFTEVDYPKPGFIKIEELKYLNIQGGDETPYVIDKVDLTNLINSIL